MAALPADDVQGRLGTFLASVTPGAVGRLLVACGCDCVFFPPLSKNEKSKVIRVNQRHRIHKCKCILITMIANHRAGQT